jgi:AcrR family transcriptional regulator
LARTDSRERILDAAERLFAEKGLQATSLRDIAAAARANTGSIYFHFKTKAELVREVFRRRLGPLDAERLAALDACQAAAAPDPPAVEEILHALVAPLLRLSRGPAAHFVRVLGRTYSEPDRETFRILYLDHGHTLDRFRAALARALPSLPEDQLLLRFHFALGALAYTMASDAVSRVLPGRRDRAADWERAMAELMPFLTGGLQGSGAPSLRRGAA